MSVLVSPFVAGNGTGCLFLLLKSQAEYSFERTNEQTLVAFTEYAKNIEWVLRKPHKTILIC